MSTCNQLDLQTLGSQPVMPKLKISLNTDRRLHYCVSQRPIYRSQRRLPRSELPSLPVSAHQQ